MGCAICNATAEMRPNPKPRLGQTSVDNSETKCSAALQSEVAGHLRVAIDCLQQLMAGSPGRLALLTGRVAMGNNPCAAGLPVLHVRGLI